MMQLAGYLLGLPQWFRLRDDRRCLCFPDRREP